MSSRPESKTASQFVSLTMRLKDKLHPQRIRRTERVKHTLSQRRKPADLNLQEHTLHHKSRCVLADQQRAVITSLQYFKALVDRLGLDRPGVDKLVLDQSVVGGLLGGASGGVLEAVQILVQLEPHLHNSKTVSTCLTRLYLSLAQLIRWADQVMLQGVAHDDKEPTASVTTVIRAVLDGVKLFCYSVLYLLSSGSLSPSGLIVLCVLSCPAVSSSVPQQQRSRSECYQHLVLLWSVSPVSWFCPVLVFGPVLPVFSRLLLLCPLVLSCCGLSCPPSSPPYSFCCCVHQDLVRLAAEREEGSTPLSPVQSQPAMGQMGGFDEQETSDRMSTCRSPAQEEDGGEETVSAPPKPLMPLPQVPSPQGLSPPALPPKKRQSLPGPASCRVAIVAPMRREPEVETQDCEDDDYLKRCSSSSADSAADNTYCEEDPDYDFLHTDLSSSETLPPLPPPSSPPPALPEKRRRSAAGTTNSEAPPSFEFDSAPQKQVDPAESLSSPLSPSKTPPPLPEKKRHIHQYLQFCSSYSAQPPSIFYQTPPTFRQREMETAYLLTHTHLDTDSAPSPELPPAPALPPKKKQQDSAEDDKLTTENQSRDSLSSQQQEEEEEEEQEEVLLTDREEVLHRITMKPEEEEGPDVKAASPDILVVYATETDISTEPVLYCEAFLSTYRTFIRPDDVISKLQHRYKHLCEGREPEHLKAAKKTFHLLVRVVDELCVMELDSDLLLLLMDLVFSLLIGGELGPAHLLRSNILSKMEQKWQRIGSPQSLRPLAARGVAARPGTLLDFRSQDLAEQLTLLDSELFYKIELPEVLLWSKEQNEEKSPNLTEFTQHFNNVSFWVRSVIILQDKPQDREKLLLKFLKIMKHLRKLNNFNSYLSILSALDSAPLRRLDWQRSTAEALEEYSSLIDSSSSFRAYRAALAEVEPPCIPYLGLILQDLTFVHLGNPDTLMTSQGSKVNFSKRWQQFNILYTLRSYQQAPYSLQPNDDIILFFNDFSDHLAEEALWELSLRLRPRNTPRTNQR
ncbi:rap guanine nucleotide exchange factor 1-like isoform X2 [Seriola dumerili]|uniref:rap guanine nucleotide exchange factor 1-like isoform X2 n=1 Tax=Seriola dumerili TaxID=41447 RepID=UPI000BBE500B|nr:rap guanine nucleotide exchange factor 1-like isoform X2 [Seriola dumerili]